MAAASRLGVQRRDHAPLHRLEWRSTRGLDVSAVASDGVVQADSADPALPRRERACDSKCSFTSGVADRAFRRVWPAAWIAVACDTRRIAEPPQLWSLRENLLAGRWCAAGDSFAIAGVYALCERRKHWTRERIHAADARALLA